MVNQIKKQLSENQLKINHHSIYDDIKRCRMCEKIPESNLEFGKIWNVSSKNLPKYDVIFVGMQPNLKGHYENPKARADTTNFYDFINQIKSHEIENFTWTNLVKCAIKENAGGRKLLSKEVDNCIGWLIEEIKVFKPKIIVFVGKSIFDKYHKRLLRQQLKEGLNTEISFCYHYSPLAKNLIKNYEKKQTEFINNIKEKIK